MLSKLQFPLYIPKTMTGTTHPSQNSRIQAATITTILVQATVTVIIIGVPLIPGTVAELTGIVIGNLFTLYQNRFPHFGQNSKSSNVSKPQC